MIINKKVTIILISIICTLIILAYLFSEYIMLFFGLILGFFVIAILFLIFFLLYDYFSHYKEDFKRGIIKCIYIISISCILIILLSSLLIFFWIIINKYYGNNIGINDGDSLRIIFYIFQLFIVFFGIFIGYLNFRELMRKNTGDHFPDILISKEGVKSISNVNIKESQDYLNIDIENVSNNRVEVYFLKFKVFGDNDEFRGRTKNKQFRSTYIMSGKNVIHPGKTGALKFRMIHGVFKNTHRGEIYLILESYGVKKNIVIFLDYKKNKKHILGDKFIFKSFKYEL